MVRLGHIMILAVLISVMVVTGCGDGGIDPDLTIYTTIDEESSTIGSEGGQIHLGDGSNVAISEDTLAQYVAVALSRKSSAGQLPRSIEEDSDNRLISDFYFVEVDKVLNQSRGITLEFPFESTVPSSQVRVIEVFNIGNETYPRFIDATVDEISGKIIIANAELSPTYAAVQEYETESPPTGDSGFHGMDVSIGYAAVSDIYQSNLVLSASCIQRLSSGGTGGCSNDWWRIICTGERADVLVSYLLGTSDEMMEYAHSALEYAEGIQRAYSDAGFETHDKVVVYISELVPESVHGAHASIPMFKHRIWTRDGLDASRGGALNFAINHEIVHTMQSFVQHTWWKESSADWGAYYFEPDPAGRRGIWNNILLINSSQNPFREPFPPTGLSTLGADEIYDYAKLIDYAVEAGHLTPGDIVRFINEGYDPTDEFEDIYRYQADGFAQYLAEVGVLKPLAVMTSAEGEFDSRSAGSVVLSMDVAPLTLPVKRYSAQAAGLQEVTFRVSLEEVTNEGGIVVGSTNTGFEGLVDKYETSLTTAKAVDIYILPFANGDLNAQIKLLIEWEPSSANEFALVTSSTDGGSVTTPAEGTSTYSAGTVVDLVATRASGYEFLNWTGDVGTVADVDSPSTTITMNDNYSIKANFEKIDEVTYYTLTTTVSPSGAGSVSPAGGTYASGTQATITATPASGYTFSHWGGDASGSQNPIVVTMNSNKSITAYVEEEQQDEVVCFPDPKLEAAIRNAIGKPTGDIYQSDLDGLTSLSARMMEIADLTGLEHCTSLTDLDLRYNQISDVSPLANLTSLRSLALCYWNQISDISPLANLSNLTELRLSDNQISDISPLAPLTKLTMLLLPGNQISDISPLANLTTLTNLVLDRNEISDVSALANLASLTILQCAYNQISDISPVASLTSLTHLYLHDNEISDISPVAGLASLTFLILGNNQINDISTVAGLTTVIYLDLGGNQITDISPLAGLTSLILINLRSNQISDISPLANLASLTHLYFDQNQISDITPLAGLTKLRYLVLSYNQISDVSPLVENEGLDYGDFVDLRWNPLSDESINEHIPALQARGVTAYH